MMTIGEFDVMVEYCKNEFSDVKEAYKKLFCEMYKFDPLDAFWTGNVLEVSDYFVGLYDIMYAVNTGVNEELFFKWYDYSLTLVEYSLGDISLENFIKGHIQYKEDDITHLRELQSQFNQAKNTFDEFLEGLRNGN